MIHTQLRSKVDPAHLVDLALALALALIEVLP